MCLLLKSLAIALAHCESYGKINEKFEKIPYSLLARVIKI
jgi:hypothetical protein